MMHSKTNWETNSTKSSKLLKICIRPSSVTILLRIKNKKDICLIFTQSWKVWLMLLIKYFSAFIKNRSRMKILTNYHLLLTMIRSKGHWEGNESKESILIQKWLTMCMIGFKKFVASKLSILLTFKLNIHKKNQNLETVCILLRMLLHHCVIETVLDLYFKFRDLHQQLQILAE